MAAKVVTGGIAFLRNLLKKEAMKKSKDASGIMTLNKQLIDDVDNTVKKWVESAKKQGQDIDKMGEQELKYIVELNKPKAPTTLAELMEKIGLNDPKKNKFLQKEGEVVDMTGKTIDPGKPILGGKNVPEGEGFSMTIAEGPQRGKKINMDEFFELTGAKNTSNVDIVTETIATIKSKKPIDAMKEANSVIGRKGKYKNLTKEQSQEILKKTDDHIFERDIKYDEFGEIIKPDPEDLAHGGRTGTGLNYLLGEDDQNSRVPFAMGKRAFLKWLGSSVAGIGAAKTGLFGLLKGGGGKKVVTEVAKDVAGSGQPPAYFFNLVKKIKNLGDDAVATQDKAVAKKYKDYTLEEDFAGNIEIMKKGDDVAEDVFMSYKVDDVPVKGKKKSTKVEEYEEYTATPDRDGKMKDIEMGVPDSVVEEGTIFEDTIAEFTKKASGGRVPLSGGGGSDKVGEVLKAYKRYRRGEKNPRLNFKTFFKVYAKENFASGGRVPLAGGKGVLSLIELITKKFGKDTAKRASQLGKPQKTLDREMFQNFNKKLNPGKDSKSIIPKDEYKEYRNDFNKEILNMSPEDQLRDEFPGISDRLIRQILTDTDPQRIAEVKQTMREALKMQEKGMGHEEIIEMFKKTPRTKNASGGRVPLGKGGIAGMLGE